MRGVSAWFFGTAVVYGILGMLLGNIMGATADHSQLVTHAHMLLIGWVSFAIFGFFYHLFPGRAASVLARVHFGLAQISYLALIIALVPDLLRQYGTRRAPRRGVFHGLSAVDDPFRGHCPAGGQGAVARPAVVPRAP